MKPIPANFIDDFPIDLGEEYQPLRRALKRRRGFGLLFVRCSPAQGERLIARVGKDIPQKTVDVLSLDKPIDNLYEIIDNLPNKDKLDILFIKGLEKSLVDYIKPGIGGEGDYYKEDTVPRILGHLNLQRERFRDDFQICFVFLLPLYALKYFIRRAPDFFDWRSGVWEFPTSSDLVEQEASRILCEINPEEFFLLAAPKRKHKIFEIQEFIKTSHFEFNTKSAFWATPISFFVASNEFKKLWEDLKKILKQLKGDIKYSYHDLDSNPTLIVLQWLTFLIGNDYQEALASCDQLLELQPQNYQIWLIRGITLSLLARYEAALASYDKALELQLDNNSVWGHRGIALYNLERYEEAIASYDNALEIKPNDHYFWYYRGDALYKLRRHEEAIASYNKALEIKPDNHYIWYHRGKTLSKLERYEEAIASYDKALEINPDDYTIWCFRVIALYKLGRREEALASYDKAIEINPDDYNVWYFRGVVLYDLERYEEAIASYNKALEIKPDNHYIWYHRGKTLSELERYEEAIASFDKALEIQPDNHHAWYQRGDALYDLERYEEAIASYDKALQLKPDYHYAWYFKACCYALQGNVDLAIENLQQAIKLNPDECREKAKANSNFDSIREDQRFQGLIEG